MKTLPLAVLMLFACTTGTEVGESRMLSSTPAADKREVERYLQEIGFVEGQEVADTDIEESGWLDAFTGLDWYEQVMLLAATVGLVIIFRKPLGVLLAKVVKRNGAAKKG